MVQNENKNRLSVSFVTSVSIHLFFATIIGIYPTLQDKEIVKWTNRYVVDIINEQIDDDTYVQKNNKPNHIIVPPVEKIISDPVPTETAETSIDTDKSSQPDIKSGHRLGKITKSSRFDNEESAVKKYVTDEKKKLLTMKDLMPSYKQLLSSAKIVPQEQMKNEGVSLDTKDLKYLSYFSKVKNKIEMVWTYPESAKLNRLQGNVTLVFLLKNDGSLVYVQVIKSSGVAALDNEAVKSVKKAMPYFPLPKTLGNRLKIVATFRYSLGKFYIR